MDPGVFLSLSLSLSLSRSLSLFVFFVFSAHTHTHTCFMSKTANLSIHLFTTPNIHTNYAIYNPSRALTVRDGKQQIAGLCFCLQVWDFLQKSCPDHSYFNNNTLTRCGVCQRLRIQFVCVFPSRKKPHKPQKPPSWPRYSVQSSFCLL